MPTSYTDGRLTIRRLQVSDLDADLEAKDDEQIDWLWDPGHREAWEAMTPDEQREHAKAHPPTRPRLIWSWSKVDLRR
jgi:hypothetical protein